MTVRMMRSMSMRELERIETTMLVAAVDGASELQTVSTVVPP